MSVRVIYFTLRSIVNHFSCVVRNYVKLRYRNLLVSSIMDWVSYVASTQSYDCGYWTHLLSYVPSRYIAIENINKVSILSLSVISIRPSSYLSSSLPMSLLALARHPGGRSIVTRNCGTPMSMSRGSHTQLHPEPSTTSACALAGLHSDLERLTPRFDIYAKQIKILQNPDDFYSVLKVSRSCWYPSTRAHNQVSSLRIRLTMVWDRKKFGVLNIAYSSRHFILGLLNMNLLVHLCSWFWWPDNNILSAS